MTIGGFSSVVPGVVAKVSGGAAVLAMACVVTATVLIFALSFTFLWPVLIGCACLAVAGVITFIIARHIDAKGGDGKEEKTDLSGPKSYGESSVDQAKEERINKLVTAFCEGREIVSKKDVAQSTYVPRNLQIHERVCAVLAGAANKMTKTKNSVPIKRFSGCPSLIRGDANRKISGKIFAKISREHRKQLQGKKLACQRSAEMLQEMYGNTNSEADYSFRTH